MKNTINKSIIIRIQGHYSKDNFMTNCPYCNNIETIPIWKHSHTCSKCFKIFTLKYESQFSWK